MGRILQGFCGLFLLLIAGCGGGGSTTGNPGPGGGSGGQRPGPLISAIAPSSAIAGNPDTQLVVYGSKFENGAVVNWNNSALTTTYVSSSRLTATIPASDLAAAGNAMITVMNPALTAASSSSSNAEAFAIGTSPPSTSWVRSVGIAPQDVAWDAAHGLIYASMPSTDQAAPNTIIPVNPITGNAGTPVPAGNNPDLLSISSDSSYLWVGLDGADGVQRFRLPALTPDISFKLPVDSNGAPQQAVSLEAARVNPHTVAVVPGHWGYSPPGSGVSVYDDSRPRANSIGGSAIGTPEIDWVQWGNDDSTLFGTPNYNPGLQPMKVDAQGVTLNGTEEHLKSIYGQYVPQNGLLYSYGGVYDPVKATQAGVFNIFGVTGASNGVCTADPSLGRYFCAISSYVDGTDVSDFQLWVYDLNTYSLVNVVDFGSSANAGGAISGWFEKLVRWGNAGLALASFTDPAGRKGNGGLFLIDGAAVNPNAAPDVNGGTSSTVVASMTSLSVQSAPAGSPDVSMTITGENFSPDSTACWNCDFLNFNFLPTTYLSETQLNVTIPAQVLATAGVLSINSFDANASSFSRSALPFTVLAAPASNSTAVSVLNLNGMAMSWDAAHQMLYVATADFDPASPNSIVAIDPTTATITKTQFAGSEPVLLDVSSGGKYLYVGYDGETNEARLALPGLDSPLRWTLANELPGSAYYAGDLRAAPQNPDVTAVTLFDPDIEPVAVGGVVIFDGASRLPNALPGWAELGNDGKEYNVLAWGNSDAVLASAQNDDVGLLPLYTIAVNSSGATFLNTYPNFNEAGAEIHSDFGTGLVYSDGGKIADPVSGAIVGSLNASGLVAPDATLHRVFILGQTSAQSGSDNYTVESFDDKAFTPVSSLTLNSISGAPFSMVRWGNSGLALLTTDGLLYIVQDATFVSSAVAAGGVHGRPSENVKMLWKRPSKLAIARALRHRPPFVAGQRPLTLTELLRSVSPAR